MEIRQFEYFVAIVREGSISRAARRLHVSQPALSKQIHALEHELGVELLIRVPEGVRATEAGQRLSEMSDFLLNYVASIRTSVRTATAELRGTVNIGISPSLMPELAQLLSVEFAQQHPRLELHLTEGLPMFLCEWLDMGRLDVGIFTRWSPYDQAPRLEFADLASDEVLLVGAPGTLPSGPTIAVDATTLRSLPIAMTPGFRDLLRVGLHLGPDGDDIQPPGVEIDSLHMVRSLALRGEYCAAMPFSYVKDDLSTGALEAVSLEPALHRQVVAVTRAGRQRATAIDAIVDSAKTRLADLASLRRSTVVSSSQPPSDAESHQQPDRS
jgi:LysR family nitrogen assimilation transcriptional regulator